MDLELLYLEDTEQSMQESDFEDIGARFYDEDSLEEEHFEIESTDMERIEVEDPEIDSIQINSLEIEGLEKENTEKQNFNEEIQKVQAASSKGTELSGNRIVNIGYVFKQMKDVKHYLSRCSFGFREMKFKKEIKTGSESTYVFGCDTCGVTKNIRSHPNNGVSLNESMVLGMNSIGLGLSHMQEFCSQVNMPTMSNTLYDKLSKEQQETWLYLAKKSASEALDEEIELAKLNGEVDSGGNALITILTDGCWSKRSYGKNFNALSGFAVIIGHRTKKIIYFDVRNKYCHICKLAEVNKVPVREHDCNKNYAGPSTGMESDIIVQGFADCALRGARFHQFIADGDSNTFKLLRDIRPYKFPDVIVEKFECVNHLFRNFRKRFNNLSKVTKYAITARKLITPKMCEDICKGIRSASKHWINESVSKSSKMHMLELDVMNAPLHYLGSHENCNEYFCQKETEYDALEKISLLKEGGLLFEVLSLCQSYFANNTKSLLANYTINSAESFNNIVAKYVGGKRINYSLGASYKARVAAAVVQRNSGGHGASEFHKFKFTISPDCLMKLETTRKIKSAKNVISKKIKPKVRRGENEEETHKAYGESCEQPDMEPIALVKANKRFMDQLKENQLKRDYIQETTTEQHLSTNWLRIRQNLLTCFHFGRIINSRGPKSFKNILDEVMYKDAEFANSAENRHTRIQKREALNTFKTLFKNVTLAECGIFIDVELSFLGATPFKLCGDNHILNIICPLKEFKSNIVDAVKNNKIPFWKVKSGKVIINEKSNTYIEVQGQLHITQRKFAYVMVWLGDSPSQYRVMEIVRDDEFFDKEMKPKLTYFFNEVMIQELVNSRKARNMNLREYDEETKSFM